MIKPRSSARPRAGDAFLEQMAEDSSRRASAARALLSERDLRRQALERPAPKRLKPDASGFDLIAEVKFRSPSAGALSKLRDDPEEALRRAHEYAHAGAAMVSILTQASAFRGSLEHLRRVAEDCPVPVMRKDFPMHSYQIWEARAAGADAVLLVLRILDERQAEELLDAAAQAGMLALLEVFDERDLERALPLLAARADQELLLGINNRDLSSLQIDIERCLRFGRQLPSGLRCVAESGLESAHHVASMARAGFRLALVGSALMQSAAPCDLIRGMLQAARREVQLGR